MMETNKRDIFLKYLDQLLAGAEDIGPIEDAEISGLIDLVRAMLSAGQAIDTETREGLRERIMQNVLAGGAVVPFTGKTSRIAEDELDEDELQYVAVGLARPARGEVCPVCGSSYIRGKGKCPVCGL